MKSLYISCLLYIANLKKACGASLFQSELSEKSSNAEDGGVRWREVSVAVRTKKKAFEFLVEPMSGFIPNGHVMALIGPSGAGKSSFLSALSGTTPKGSSTIVSGLVWRESLSSEGQHERYPLSIISGEVALLQQNDLFFEMLTPREILNLAAFLQLDLDQSDQDKIVGNILDSLGLKSVESRRIGDQAGSPSGRLSGGERRRLSAALELVSDPKIWIADEIFSGLDSAQAKKVFDIMVKETKGRNIPCICAMHQPRASIWKDLDSFILLAPGGKVVYIGDREKGLEYFANLGYKCPPETTPAEFLIDLVTIDTEDKESARLDLERIDRLVNAFRNHQEHVISQNASVWDPSTKLNAIQTIPTSHRRFRSRVAALLLRSLRQNFRDVKVNTLRGVASIGLAKLFSELFSTVKKGESLAKGIADRPALISFGVINMAMMALMKTINLFGKEKKVVVREQMRKHYTSFDYLMSKSIAEIPFDMIFSAMFGAALKYFTGLRISLAKLCGTFSLLAVASASLGFAVGSITDGVDEAMTVGMPLMIILMAVGIINPSGVDGSIKKPWYIRVFKHCSPIGMAIEALCIAEFKGMIFDDSGEKWRLRDLPKMGGLALVQNGDQVLEALALDQKAYGGMMTKLAALSAFNLFLSWIGLTFSVSSFSSTSPVDFLPTKEGVQNARNTTTINTTGVQATTAKITWLRWL